MQIISFKGNETQAKAKAKLEQAKNKVNHFVEQTTQKLQGPKKAPAADAFIKTEPV